MATTMWVTPYAAVDIVSGNMVVQALRLPALADPVTVDFSAGAAKTSAAIPDGANYVVIEADTACHWTIQLQSAGAAATTSSEPLVANVPITRAMPPNTPSGGWGISAISRT